MSSHFIKILSVSRLDGKITDGIWLMINALKNYVNEDIEFNIIGDGNQKSKMEKFVKENNLGYFSAVELENGFFKKTFFSIYCSVYKLIDYNKCAWF